MSRSRIGLACAVALLAAFISTSTSPWPAHASCSGPEQSVFWRNSLVSTTAQYGTLNRIRLSVPTTIEACGADAGLPIVHTAHLALGYQYGNWVEAGFAVRYDSTQTKYNRVFVEWGINFVTLGAQGFTTAPCTRVTTPNNSNYVKFRLRKELTATSWRWIAQLDCEDSVGYRFLKDFGQPGGLMTGWPVAEYTLNWTSSSSSAFQTALQYLNGNSNWSNWTGSVCLHDSMVGVEGSHPTATSWQTQSGSGSC